MRPDRPRIAILYQALPPPVIDGLRKDAKPGGYADSGADIGFTLRQAGYDLLTPVPAPDPARTMDWVFPDTAEGIADALARGATLLWANTVLFAGHPLEDVLHKVWVVGQHPRRQQDVDDKFATNALLRAHGLPVAASCLAGHEPIDGVPPVHAIDAGMLRTLGLAFPLIVKPVRGRGSQGVTLVRDLAAFHGATRALLDGGAFGNALIVEEFLDGQELTVTVMPRQADLPAPYSSDIASALPPVGARAPIRIDCRADAHGRYKLFDLNMKPNMTGAGRPGREAEDSLSAIAARGLGWGYADLLARMASGSWRE